jgi:hypothetical protein
MRSDLQVGDKKCQAGVTKWVLHSWDILSEK